MRYGVNNLEMKHFIKVCGLPMYLGVFMYLWVGGGPICREKVKKNYPFAYPGYNGFQGGRYLLLYPEDASCFQRYHSGCICILIASPGC